MRWRLMLLLIISSCRFPHYVPEKMGKMESDITDASLYILQKGILQSDSDSIHDEMLKDKLHRIGADGFEVIYHDTRTIKTKEPLDSIVIFTRVRKSSAMSWGGEDIIYIFGKQPRKFPDYKEDDGYLFRRITDRIYYRRYFFTST
jgi:hypothetical protein